MFSFNDEVKSMDILKKTKNIIVKCDNIKDAFLRFVTKKIAHMPLGLTP